MKDKKTIMWVGISAKKDTSSKKSMPLNADTKTGKLVAEIEGQCSSLFFYKTNLVKFAPLDSKGKLRYPTFDECAKYYPKLLKEIKEIKPRVVFLLGNKTAKFVMNQLGFTSAKLSYKFQVYEYKKVWYVPIHHPSYIMVYKRKEKDQYIQAVKVVIERLTS
ncbi:MAG: uracil-DNA glycosylase family protein [Minisyncoccia bacterium]